MYMLVASYSSIFTWMGDSVPDGAGGVTLREMLSHMLKPFFSASLSPSLTSSATSGSNEDRRFMSSSNVSAGFQAFTSGGGSLARSWGGSAFF